MTYVFHAVDVRDSWQFRLHRRLLLVVNVLSV